MRVGQRLFLAVIPAILGVFTVAALAYWGQYAHTVPGWIVVIAAVAAAASLVLAWLNTRYVAQRIERLAGENPAAVRAESALRRAAALLSGVVPGRAAAAGSRDELDTIERVVDRLSSAVSVAKAAEEAQALSFEEQRREYVQLVAEATRQAMHQLEEVRLPLHILLENRFGDLNDNQEEMLGAARAAAEAADKELVRLEEIANLDAGALSLRRDRVKLADVIAAVVPALETEGAARNVTVHADIAPALPPILGDRTRLQEAFAALLRDALRRTPDGGELRLTAERVGTEIHVVITGDRGEPTPADLALAVRLLQAHGGSREATAGQTLVRLPTRT